MTSDAPAGSRPWTQCPRATFDLETTGPNPRTARIVTASLILIAPDGEVLRFRPKQKPDDPAIVGAIEAALTR